jgi:hypothetical protein
VKTKMTVRESKATQNLLAAIKAKAFATRKLEDNCKRQAEFEARRKRINAELDNEAVELNNENLRLNKERDQCRSDVKLALEATHNELLTLPSYSFKTSNPVYQKIRNKSNDPPDSRFRCR